jgi:hypothetical protein
MSPLAARKALAARPCFELALEGPRAYACSAAEWLWRAASA